MKRTCILYILLFVALLVVRRLSAEIPKVAMKESWADQYHSTIKPILSAKCVSCHGAASEDNGINLLKVQNKDDVLTIFDSWDHVTKRVRLVEMPPEGSQNLTDAERQVLLSWLDQKPTDIPCNKLATDETTNWYKGTVMSRRLTRAEYNNTIRDLFGLNLRLADQFPSDGSGGEGFDTTGDSLFTSPIHIESYLKAAQQVAMTLIPDNINNLSQEQIQARRRFFKVEYNGDIDPLDVTRINLEHYLPRAFRRPVGHEEINRYVSLFDSIFLRDGNLLHALRTTLATTLISPHFLFLVETDSSGDGVQRLSSFQLANRISYFLWSSMPDEELFSKAADGTIYQEDVVKYQIHRMLKDHKSRALGEQFGQQWLGLESLGNSHLPETALYPGYTPELAASMKEETVRFLHHLFQENRPITEIITADYTFADNQLAKVYNLPQTQQHGMEKVRLTDQNRGGIVTMASVLTISSYPNRTSPVLRGKYILEEVLGTKVPPAPENVPKLEEQNGPIAVVNLREKLEAHRKSPECAACHNRMDPLGFGLESFDAIGAKRTADQGVAIDDTGTLPDGKTFRGPAELKQILLERKDDVSRNFVKKLMGYALGRELNKFDECTIEQCLEQLRSHDYRSQVVLETIVLSYPFQHRYYKK